MIAHLATLLLLPAAILAWRLSRPIAIALGLVLSSTLAYLALAHAYPEAHARGAFEAQRLVSAVVGLVGAWELGRRARSRISMANHRRRAQEALNAKPYRGLELWLEKVDAGVERWRFGRVDAIALLCLASMASDGAAWFLYRAGRPWVFDLAQVLFLTAMIVIAWPRKRGSS